MVAVKNLVFLLSAVSAAVLPSKRDAGTVYQDLEKIDDDTQAFTAAINKWDGQLFTAASIQSAENTLNNDIKQAASDTNGISGTVPDDQAQAAIDYINNVLEPDVSKALTALAGRKAQFKQDGLTSTVLSGLKNTKNSTDSLGAALASKASSGLQSAAQAAQAKIDQDFNTAIAAFSS